MTAQEALDKAESIWGKHACAVEKDGIFQVGYVIGSVIFNIMGSGASWEEAFLVSGLTKKGRWT